MDGFATPDGTKKYMEYSIQNGKPANHFRSFDGLYLSSIGMGTYLGEPNAKDDKAIEDAIYESVKSGSMNVIDTAINYRAMKSEKSVGRAIARLVNEDIISRDEIFVSTKNGYITNDGDYPTIDIMEYMYKMFISTEIIKPDDISSGYNVLNPNYIARCIDKSLSNLHLNTLDLVYIHNALESWYEDVSRNEFMEMLYKVFEVYEKFRSNHKISYYGMATWTCFRVKRDSKDYLSLEQVVKIAEEVGGERNGFRFIQLPYNLAYSEPLFLKNQAVGAEENLTILEAASKLNIGVFTSIPLFQGRLLNTRFADYGGITDQVIKLVQIIRSTPSVIAPLIGQKKMEHVRQNLKIADIPPMNDVEFQTTVQTLLKGIS